MGLTNPHFWANPSLIEIEVMKKYPSVEEMIYQEFVGTELDIVSCKKCKGTGILDFEFYTRKCECKLR